MAKIAIMGFGTVGSGVLEVCRRNAASIARRAGEPVEVKYILDVRDFSGSPDAALFTKSITLYNFVAALAPILTWSSCPLDETMESLEAA